MARFLEMIENVKEAKNIEEAIEVVKVIRELIRNMGNNFEEELVVTEQKMEKREIGAVMGNKKELSAQILRDLKEPNKPFYLFLNLSF